MTTKKSPKSPFSVKDYSVATKVYLGTGIILVFLAIVATVSFFGLSGANSSFSEYRQVARETNQLGRIQVNLLEARLAARAYVFGPSQELADTVERRVGRTSNHINSAVEMVKGSEDKQKLQGTDKEFSEYYNSFLEVRGLVKREDELREILDTVGPRIEDNLTEIVDTAFRDQDLIASHLAGKEIRDLMLVRLYANQFLLKNDEASIEKVKANLNSFKEISERLRAELQSPTRRRLAEAVKADAEIYEQTFEAVVDVINQKNEIVATDMRLVGRKVATDMEALMDENGELQDKIGPEATASMSTALNTTTIVAIGAILIGAAIAYFISKMIADPVRNMTSAMSRLAGGDLEVEIPAIGRGDEIGNMAGAVLSFKEAALEKQEVDKREAEREAQDAAQRKQREDEKEQQAQRTKFAVSSMADGLNKFAEGDLTVQLNDQFDEELDGLRVNFNNSITKINQTLVEISAGAQSIDMKTQEIRSSADSLSKRTESQAASLEETAAALEEITATVTETSVSAKDARDVAQQAKTDTDESSKVVTNAMSAMERIESASSEISQIISVIDEIAFQTNLLALNAGVEAARAGDAGSGFAVVAQEVRELAQRCAEAAKEITDLITKSNTEVTSGVELVKAAGKSLETISEHVTQMNDKMISISKAADEQLAGVKEVNTAVADMDNVTQQNAAMVEESTAVTFDLASDVNNLSEMIGQFRLSGSDHELRVA